MKNIKKKVAHLKAYYSAHKDKIKGYLKSAAKPVLICVLVATIALKGPETHYNYIRNKVQKTTVLVTNQARTSGGSGSHVIAPSGQVYILTNAHVCSVGKEDGIVYITDNFGRTIPRRILEVSDFTDLCLVEPLPNYHGALKLGSNVRPGQIVASVGHPSLMPTTMSRGEIIGEAEVDVLDHVMNPLDEEDTCNLPKNRIIKGGFFGLVSYCVIHVKANLTNVIILPGNSGSPQVDFWGNLNGVFFAGNRANWGLSITLSDVKAFLQPY
jgi:S1-C subfamily serine protease